jgi:gas vesicle protein GvpG
VALILDSLLMSGLRFVLDKLVDAADAEQDEEPILREDLVALQLRLELGEIGEAEFVERERAILLRLRELREEREGGPASSFTITGIEAEFVGEEHGPPEPPAAPRRRPRRRRSRGRP